MASRPNGEASWMSSLCTLCTRQNPSTTCCYTCNKSLCHFCEQAHKHMVCFQTHKIFPLGEEPEQCLVTAQDASFFNANNLLVSEIAKILLKNDELTSGCNNLPEPDISPLSPRNGVVAYPDPSVETLDLDPNNPRYGSNQMEMQIYKTFGQRGAGKGQFQSPHGFCLGFNDSIVVADSLNHRVQIFDKSGMFKFQFGVGGRHDGHLWHPRKVAVLPIQRKYVVCDRGFGRSRMQVFSEDGSFFKKIYIQFIDIVAGITVTANEEIVVVDSVKPTIFVIGRNDFLRSIDCKGFMEEPSDIVAVGDELYVCDFKGHSIVVVNLEGVFLRKIGNKQIVSFPNGIDVAPTGEILVGDSHGNYFHVAVFSKYGAFIADFRCPFIKVSRCCGLKLTANGHIVTVDKNYHHVIILA